ncbi:MAG TPA: AMP-binding protein [Nitrososphaera sp.]|nr:AMP-binding protein [Nitrososphaera sp.]
MGSSQGDFAFTPSSEHLGRSNIARFMQKHGISGWRQLIEKSTEDIGWYWDAVNSDLGIEWFAKYDRVYDSSAGIPFTKWFLNGKCNIIANAIDRHARTQPDKVAYIFAGETGSKKVTYGELDTQVSRLARALADSGVGRGDVVGIYMPMVAEAFYAILACSKIGAVHTTVFSGYGAHALRSRLIDSRAKLLITSDSMRRRGKEIDLGSQWAAAVQGTQVSKVVSTTGNTGATNYSDFVKTNGKVETERMDSEDPLFILYTSGTTGEPKGTLQVHGGFTLVSAQQSAYLVDMKPDDTLFWYADIGWITGQVWPVYGSAIIGASSIIYEDALDYPDAGTWCELAERHRATIFGVAPTAIRSFIKNNLRPDRYDLASLRIIATTGEPINKEAWDWYYDKVGGRRCPVINVSGGTEIGGAIVGALPVMPLKECTVGCPLPGFDADVFDEGGKSVSQGEGYLVIKKPWPSMTRGLVGNPARYKESYWSKYSDVWYHGDIVYVDSDGLWYMRGRADDVIKVSGHRIGTAEIEEAATSHPKVAEAAAIGRADDLKGESIVLCVVLKDGSGNSQIESEIIETVGRAIGKFARPDEVRFVSELPKTRTGKVLRRLVRAKVAGLEFSAQDISAVENPECLGKI